MFSRKVRQKDKWTEMMDNQVEKKEVDSKQTQTNLKERTKIIKDE